jgi:hypothetical protein
VKAKMKTMHVMQTTHDRMNSNSKISVGFQTKLSFTVRFQVFLKNEGNI